MIYAIFNFDTEDWLLLGDFPTECGVVEFAVALAESPCFKHDTFGVYRIGSFDSATGNMVACPRVRVWQHSPADRGGRAVGGGTPPTEVGRAGKAALDLVCRWNSGVVAMLSFLKKLTPIKSKK